MVKLQIYLFVIHGSEKNVIPLNERMFLPPLSSSAAAPVRAVIAHVNIRTEITEHTFWQRIWELESIQQDLCLQATESERTQIW